MENYVLQKLNKIILKKITRITVTYTVLGQRM